MNWLELTGQTGAPVWINMGLIVAMGPVEGGTRLLEMGAQPNHLGWVVRETPRQIHDMLKARKVQQR